MENIFVSDKNRYRLAVRFAVVFAVFVAAIVFAFPKPANAAGSLIYIEPGHGLNSGSYSSPGGFYEDVINLAIAQKLNDLLRQNGYQTYMARTDNAVNLSGTHEDIDMAQANAMGAAIFVSIHNDSVSFPSGHGTSVFYETPGSLSFAQKVTNNVYQELSNVGYATDMRGSPQLPWDGHWMIGDAQMPAILIEGLFISNPVEAQLLKQDYIQSAIARALFRAIAETVPPASSAQFPLFRWNSVTGAKKYRIELMSGSPTNPNGLALSGNNISTGETTSTFWLGDTTSMAVGTYYWRIFALDAGGNPFGSSTDAQSFEVPKATLLSSFAGSNPGTLFPVFSWQAVPAATAYELELLSASPENPNSKVASAFRLGAGRTTATSWTGDLRGYSPGRYYYRVKAINSFGDITGFSDADSFTVPKVTLTNTFNGSAPTTQFPKFTWSALTGATAYGIELLSAPPENPNGNTPSRYRLAAAPTSNRFWDGDIRGLAVGTYYYRIIAISKDGLMGGFSDVDSFAVPKVTLNPVAWDNPSKPVFSWQSLNGATSYGIEYLYSAPENPNGNTPSRYRLAAAPTTDNHWNGDIAGLAGGAYYYRVIAINQFGLMGGFSDAAQFNVLRPNLSAITWPDSNHPHFSWSPVAGATSYEIEWLDPNTPPADNGAVTPDPHRRAVDATVSTWFDSDISAGASGATYYYRVIAKNGDSILGIYSLPGSFVVPPHGSSGASLSVIVNGAYSVYDQVNSLITTVPANGTTQVSYSGGSYTVTTCTGFTRTMSSYVRILPSDWQSVINVNEMPEYSMYQGAVEIRFSNWDGNPRLYAINEIDMDGYLSGMGEEPETWPGGDPTGTTAQYMEFLKVSAIDFRSYAYDVLQKKNKHADAPFELCNSPANCQWYIGYARKTQGNNLSAAVVTTSGLVVKHDGVPVRTPYFSECGGVTQAAIDHVPSWNYPWCISVSDASIPGVWVGCTGETPSNSHHVGMCMDGARRRAAWGATCDQITHYYYHSDPGYADIKDPIVRIAVFSLPAA